MIRKKILLLGDFGVGKTSLIRRYIDNTFDDSYHTTIGVKISRKKIEFAQNTFEFLIWDIEGATPIKQIPQSYMSGSSGAIIVGDITREDTLEHIELHRERFERLNGAVPSLYVYNKSDLVTEDRLRELNRERRFIPTSAKTGMNVELMFFTLMEEIFHATS